MAIPIYNADYKCHITAVNLFNQSYGVHIKPLIINSLGSRHTYTHAQTHTYMHTYRRLHRNNFKLLYLEKHDCSLQAITSPNNSPVRNRHSGYLKLSFIIRVLATYLIYYRLYFLYTSLLQLEYG